MGTDARIRYTKMIIKEKFTTLLKDRPLNKITVKEICSLAEINRATFYKYYNDPFDLLEQMEQDFLNELNQKFGQVHIISFKDTFLIILKELQKNSDLYKTLFSEHGDSQFPARLFAICYKENATSIHRQFPKLSFQEQEFLYYFIAHGCSGILSQWISNGMKEPIENIAEFADRLIKNTMCNL